MTHFGTACDLDRRFRRRGHFANCVDLILIERRRRVPVGAGECENIPTVVFCEKFAHTVDIHAKPGYDPVELFFNPKTKSIPLDATLVKGSHGAPAALPQQEGALLCSGGPLEPIKRYRDVDMPALVCKLLGVPA